MESIIQAYYIDGEHPEAGIDCKFEILKEIEKQRLIGGKLIDRTDLKNKEELKNLYSELSGYVHSSLAELSDVMEAMLSEKKERVYRFYQRLFFVFDEDLFNKCVEFTNRVMDVVYFVSLSLFPEVAQVVRNQTLKLLEELACNHTINYIKNR